MNNVQLLEQPYDPWVRIADFQRERFGDSASFGATTVFTGTMRDFNEGDDVSEMFLEHYPGMTESYLKQLADLACSKWEISDCLILHRVGTIQPADTIVVTAAWSAHRKAAFEACRFLIEELKHNAPFWKHETLHSGEQRWVAENTPG